MIHPKAHKTKWTVLYLISNSVMRFDSEESAKCHALAVGYTTPVRVIPPIYGD